MSRRADVFKPRRQSVDRAGLAHQVESLAVAANQAGCSRHPPQFRFGTMADHRRMTRRAGVRFAGRPVERSDEFAHGVADADALEIGQADGAVLAPAGARRMRKRQHGGEGCRLALHQGGEAGGGGIQISAQIVMRLEKRPRRAIGADDLERDRRAMPSWGAVALKILPAGGREIRSPKSQSNPKSKIPMDCLASFGHWGLAIDWDLELGIWSLRCVSRRLVWAS